MTINHSLFFQLLFAGGKFWYHGKQKYSQISQLIQNHLKLNWVSLSLQSHIIRTNDICMESVRRVALVNELWGPLWWKSIDNTSLVQLGKLVWSPDYDMFEPIGLLCPCLSRHLPPPHDGCVYAHRGMMVNICPEYVYKRPPPPVQYGEWFAFKHKTKRKKCKSASSPAGVRINLLALQPVKNCQKITSKSRKVHS